MMGKRAVLEPKPVELAARLAVRWVARLAVRSVARLGPKWAGPPEAPELKAPVTLPSWRPPPNAARV
jgi:hypothetical protein